MDTAVSERIQFLEAQARTIRKLVITTFYEGKGGHFGGCLSVVDLLAALYCDVLRLDPRRPRWSERDRFILSKGHASVALGCTLAHAGFFPLEWLKSYTTMDSPISQHPDMRRTPGVEISTGSLGHGIAIALGMALAAKLDRKTHRVFCLVGDGESNEGSVWEVAMAAAHFGLDNLIVVTDRNGLSMDGPTCDVMELEPLAAKWEAFGWSVREIDGHDMTAIVEACDVLPFEVGKPSQIIANTVKGKGLWLAEGVTAWHYGSLSTDDMQRALRELEGASG